MTEEQIKQNAESIVQELSFSDEVVMYSRDNMIFAAIKGAHSRDNEVEMLQNEIEELSEQLKMNAENIQKLRNPWISVEEPPKKTDVYYVRTQQGCADMAYFDSLNKKWEKGRFTDGTVSYWMPIPELKKGVPELKKGEIKYDK